MQSVGPSDSLDAKFFYTGEQARNLFANFSLEDKEAYFLNEIFDLFLIFSYSFLFLTLKRHLFALVPGFFDLVETLTVLYALKYGEPFNVFSFLGVMTALKWSTGALFIVWWWRQKKRNHPVRKDTPDCCGV